MIFGGRRIVRRSEETFPVELDTHRVEVRLRRSSRRRSLALRVDRDGVTVSAPFDLAWGEIRRFVDSQRSWLERKLEVRQQAAAKQRFEAFDGARFALAGEPARLVIREGAGRSMWLREEDGSEALHVPAKADARSALLRALKQRALERFEPRLIFFCSQLGVAVPPLKLTSARTRWGSCSLNSGIRLHWRLVHLKPELADYVIAHEVAHLVEMNHSPRFWRIVETLYPDWREARRALAEAAVLLPAIDARDAFAPADQ
ncbi:MAG TPA: SprT family zinc-dependent metalloprotease [Azoarcus sp.]|nr:SprT family zinc-dependent metalloprotease [Azoarcus sp.]